MGVKETKVESFFRLKRVLDCLCHVFIINKRQKEIERKFPKKSKNNLSFDISRG